MSILDRFARPQLNYQDLEKRTLSVRVPAKLYEQFQRTCKKNGLTMSEGIRILLELDLGESNQPTAHDQKKDPDHD